MADDPIRKRLVIRGRVQGVFFRDSTRERARAEGVSGWARNLDDGSLEVVLEGPPGAVERVERFCGTGPAGARVEQVQAHEEPPEGLAGFQIG
jgi:acylphosphatase